MAPSNPLANWEKVGDSFYRKIPVYDAIFDEDVELENYIVAGAPYGGAIGMFQFDPSIESKLNGSIPQLSIAMRANRSGCGIRKAPGLALRSILARGSTLIPSMCANLALILWYSGMLI